MESKVSNKNYLEVTIEDLIEVVNIIKEGDGSIGRYVDDGPYGDFGEPDLEFYLDLKKALNLVLKKKHGGV